MCVKKIWFWLLLFLSPMIIFEGIKDDQIEYETSTQFMVEFIKKEMNVVRVV